MTTCPTCGKPLDGLFQCSRCDREAAAELNLLTVFRKTGRAIGDVEGLPKPVAYRALEERTLQVDYDERDWQEHQHAFQYLHRLRVATSSRYPKDKIYRVTFTVCDELVQALLKLTETPF